METRLRVGRAIAKTEEEVAPQLMKQIKRHAPEDPPPALSTDGKGAYREALLETWGTVPAYGGRGRPPTVPKAGKDWQYLQVIKRREGSKLVRVTTKVIYGDQEEVKRVLGEHCKLRLSSRHDCGLKSSIDSDKKDTVVHWSQR